MRELLLIKARFEGLSLDQCHVARVAPPLGFLSVREAAHHDEPGCGWVTVSGNSAASGALDAINDAIDRLVHALHSECPQVRLPIAVRLVVPTGTCLVAFSRPKAIGAAGRSQLTWPGSAFVYSDGRFAGRGMRKKQNERVHTLAKMKWR